jgi:hypothetical protein
LGLHHDRLATGASQRLPTGRCNFTNLSVGGAAPPRCGCQRFWAQPESGKTLSDRQSSAMTHELSAMCACQHHACFHESNPSRDASKHQIISSKRVRSSSQHSREVSQSQLSRPADKRLRQAVAAGDVYEEVRGRRNTSQANLLSDSNLPDTGGWVGHVQPGPGPSGLPPIPSQCLLPSDLSSGSIAGNSQSFQSYPTVEIATAARQDHVMQDQYTAHGQQPPGEALVESFIQSVTEIITPRPSSPVQNGGIEKHIAGVQATVDALALDMDREHGEVGNPNNATAVATRPTAASLDGRTDERSSTPIHQLVPHLQNILRHVSSHPTLSTKVSNHEQRLDLLENAFDSHVGAQEVDEKFDIVEERIGEVETRVEELEKTTAAMNDVSSSDNRRRRHLDEEDSETSSAMISSVLDRAELSNRIESLELQFMDLQSSTLPSYVRPLQIEVIFLPFGSDLKGIWTTLDKFPSQRSKHNSLATDDRHTQYSTIAKSQAALSGLQDEQNIWKDLQGGQNDWLVARACAQGSKVEERLRSRGLVKTINVKGPDARDVQAAMLSAFGDLPKAIAGDVGAEAQLSSTLQGYHGLNAPWIPLRKLHRDSRLRFLDPSEMVTSALWTVTFLSSGVAMRAAGSKRLYVTQRESYLQTPGTRASWTWQDLRVLPRVFPDNQPNAEVGEADALEACWEWDERLDPPLSLHTSFASQHSQLSTLSIRAAPSRRSRSSGSSHSESAHTPVPSTTPTSVAFPRAISPLMERSSPLRARTISMPSIPSMPSLKTPPLQGKRRIASLDFEQSPPRQIPSSPLLAQKRRRISRSPSRPRDGLRWSIGPPSPFCFEDANHISADKRGTTPFAYATPFSNAPPYQEARHEIMDDQDELGSTTDDVDIGEHDYDSDVDQEFGQGQKMEDEVWEGVEDGMDEVADDEESDQERKALSIDGEGNDAASDVSSGPSEYPSTQPSALYAGNKGVFHIHVDEEHDARQRS